MENERRQCSATVAPRSATRRSRSCCEYPVALTNSSIHRFMVVSRRPDWSTAGADVGARARRVRRGLPARQTEQHCYCVLCPVGN